MVLSHLSEHVKHNFDLTFIGVMVGTLFSWLPHISALLSVIWFLLRIYETRTVQKWFGKTPPCERQSDRDCARREGDEGSAK